MGNVSVNVEGGSDKGWLLRAINLLKTHLFPNIIYLWHPSQNWFFFHAIYIYFTAKGRISTFFLPPIRLQLSKKWIPFIFLNDWITDHSTNLNAHLKKKHSYIWKSLIIIRLIIYTVPFEPIRGREYQMLIPPRISFTTAADNY